MLKQRIISTLQFFDLQAYPLTLFELQKFLIADMQYLRANTDNQGEVFLDTVFAPEDLQISLDKILECLDAQCIEEVKNIFGFVRCINIEVSKSFSKHACVARKRNSGAFTCQVSVHLHDN